MIEYLCKVKDSNEVDEILYSDEYSNHVSAMTKEKLHSKSDIAIELARRDIALNKFKSLVKPAYKNTLSQIDTVRNSVQHIFRLDGELYVGPLIKEGNDIYYVDDENKRRFIDRDTPCIYTEELHLLFGEE